MVAVRQNFESLADANPFGDRGWSDEKVKKNCLQIAAISALQRMAKTVFLNKREDQRLSPEEEQLARLGAQTDNV